MADARIRKPSLASSKSKTANNRHSIDEVTRAPDGDSPSHRLIKKRESDRACQRASRQRKKSRIAYLEALVEQMKEAQASGQMNALLQRISQLQADNDSMQRKLSAIESILLPTKTQTQSQIEAGAPGSSTDVIRELPQEHVTTAANFASLQQGNHSPSGFEDPEGSTFHNELLFPFTNSPLLHEGTSQMRQNNVPHMWPEIPPSVPSTVSSQQPYLGIPSPTQWIQSSPSSRIRSCECHRAMNLGKSGLNLNHWYHGNATLGAWMRRPSLIPTLLDTDLFDEDTPVRAVIEGWDAVERRGNVHPLWRLMRAMDESLFTHAEGSTNRIAMLVNVGRLLRAHIDPSRKLYSKLPQYFLDSHGQGRYAYATNFLAWPGARRALIAREHQYCSNRFWRLFIKSMRVHWSFEVRDCYHYNTLQAVYTISPTFLSALDDLRNLGVTRDFFEHYPEFRSTIVAIDEIPPSISMALPGCQYTGDIAEELLISSHNSAFGMALAAGLASSPSDIFDGSHGTRQGKEEGGEMECKGEDETEEEEEGEGEQSFQMPSWGAPGQRPRYDFVPEAAPLLAGRDFL